jgi:hypothetical protein
MTEADRFTIYQQVPRELWEDQAALYHVLPVLWREGLAGSGGQQAPGPVLIQPLSYVRYEETNDDNLIREVPTTRDGPWVVVCVRVTGPVFPPQP